MRLVVDVVPSKNEVDQVGNMVESSTPSNQALNNVVDPAKPSAMKSPALSEDDNKNGKQQMIQDEAVEQEAIKAAKWLGVVVYRDLDGRRYMGRVLKFKAETKLFEVYYENHVTEYVSLEVLQRMVASRGMVSRYLNCDVRVDPCESAAKNKRQLGDEAVPVHPRYVTPSSREQPAPQPKKRRIRKAAAPSTYVPLAVREKKKDEYYYY